jgi:hypothetical protein
VSSSGAAKTIQGEAIRMVGRISRGKLANDGIN